jgi:hypothetical protein
LSILEALINFVPMDEVVDDFNIFFDTKNIITTAGIGYGTGRSQAIGIVHVGLIDGPIPLVWLVRRA